MDKEIVSAASIEAALIVLQRWQSSTEEIQALICSDPELIKTNLILEIDQALSSTFSNEANIYGFVRMQNRNGKFKGSSPMKFMINEGIDGMKYTLDAIRYMTNW